MAFPKAPTARAEAAFLNKTKKVPRQAYPIRLSGELYHWLHEFSAGRDRPMSDVMREALREYREKHDPVA